MTIPSQHLAAAQIAIAGQFSLSLLQLRDYMQEDTIGGYHSDANKAKWPVGSLWEVEGQLLYALVRILQPELVVEIGTHLGCSTTHMAAAVMKNGVGKVITCDTRPMIPLHDGKNMPAGGLIPKRYRPVVQLHQGDGVMFLQDMVGYGAVGFVYEDGDHSAELTRAAWNAASAKLAAGGMVASHDAAHFMVGADVWAGVMQSGVSNAHRHLIDPSDCGMALWRAPLDRTFAARQLEPEARPTPVQANGIEDAYTDWTKIDILDELDKREIEHYKKDNKATLKALLIKDDALEH